MCVCGISSCRSQSETEAPFISTEELQPEVIDATVDPQSRCGIDGIGCNDTALINYTRTEADYRAYGERTEQDHLYTQAAAGNNLVATIPPTVEEDIVTEYQDYSGQPNYSEGFQNQEGITLADNNNYNNYNNYIVGQGAGYEVVCTEGCENFSENNDLQFSEFTDESFDLEDYVKPDDENIEFTEIGDKKETEEVAVEEEITDDTILTWDAKEGDTLRELLTAWSNKSGWKLLWNTNRNYTLTAGVMFKGKFTDVSSALIRAFARARPAPIATYYKGNRVIVVETMENENAY